MGYKYVSGGSSPSTGFDCSGFTSYVYKQCGISISRSSSAQASNGTAVSKSNLQPGVLVIFNNRANTCKRGNRHSRGMTNIAKNIYGEIRRKQLGTI